MTVVYAKPTNFCNIGCEHCYLPLTVRSDKTRMSFDLVRQAAELALEAHAKNGDKGHILWIWHGGEPLLMSQEWYFDAGKILDEVLGDKYVETIQTSLIPYNSKHAELIKTRFGGHVGSSIDFSQRKIKNSPETYMELWLKKVNMARSDGINVIPGIVPTKNEIDRASHIVEWMVKNDFFAFNIDRYNSYNFEANDRPTNKEHARFLIDLFEEVFVKRFLHGKRAPLVNVVTAAIRGILFGVSGDRWGSSCMSSFIVVEPTGFLNNCPDKSSPSFGISHLSNGYKGFVSSHERRKWIRIQISDATSHCSSCEYFSWCRGGCPINKRQYKNDDECPGFKSYLNHVKTRLEDETTRKAALAYLSAP